MGGIAPARYKPENKIAFWDMLENGGLQRPAAVRLAAEVISRLTTREYQNVMRRIERDHRGPTKKQRERFARGVWWPV
jgi:hypothetical protein